MNKREWAIIAAICISILGACNILWASIKSSLTWGVPSTPTLHLIALGVIALPIIITIVLLIAHARTGRTLAPASNRERLGFTAIVLTCAAACYLLWIWIRVPPEAGSPTLAVMSFIGFGAVAGPICLGIGLVGVHLLSRNKGT